MAEPSERVVVQRGLWYGELEVGATYRHSPGRTISEADNAWFSALTMNQQALHVDSVFAAEQEFGRPLVNSMMTLAMIVGLSVNQLTQGTLVANLGFESVRFPAPLFHGDTLRAQTIVTSKRESKSRPGQGVVTLQHNGFNQHGDVVVDATRNTLWLMEPR
jgi:acyl dehydratase